jgi:hypothetical protein
MSKPFGKISSTDETLSHTFEKFSSCDDSIKQITKTLFYTIFYSS